MKPVLFACLFLVFSVSFSTPLENIQLDLENEWESFKKEYARVYKDAKEESKRKAIFADNLKELKFHNMEHSQGLTSFTLGINHLSDMTSEEIVQQLCGYKQDPNFKLTGDIFEGSLEVSALPTSVDWRKSGYVTPVKNQGNCGSCWAFSSTGSLEGQMFKKTNKLVGLSEQNLVDCSRAQGNRGCNGGWMHDAFDYIRKNGGMNNGATYPYEARDGNCRYDKTKIAAQVVKHVSILKNSEQKLMEAVATVGPVSVAIDASLRSFSSYKTGIFDDARCSQTRVNHAVLVVGYGTEGGKDFWIVKNSWGTTWGDKGYIKMVRNKNNQCGIASSAVYPVV